PPPLATPPLPDALPIFPQTRRTLRRPAAARRPVSGPDQPTGPRLRGRTDRSPGQRVEPSGHDLAEGSGGRVRADTRPGDARPVGDRKSTRLNSSHVSIS